ncbi:MAG: PEP-CTERM sorting domain-containing protein, partial [Myxococcales bacterium]|nr:PEP-CTERM sorting domain-containing protein [Myxococcales bacterium]
MLRSGTHLLAALFVALPAAAEPDCGIEALGWAEVGHPGNPPDAERMLDGTSGYGAVDHRFEIQSFELTNAQYVAFLEAVAASDPHALYAADMAIFGGIDRSGSPGGYVYEVRAGFACEPVNFVPWYNALRFANWMHNGQPVG